MVYLVHLSYVAIIAVLSEFSDFFTGSLLMLISFTESLLNLIPKVNIRSHLYI